MSHVKGEGDGRKREHCKFTQALDVLYWARFGGPVPLPEIEVVLWAISQRRPPDVEAIRARWNVSRATAFRWAPKLAEAHENWAALMHSHAVATGKPLRHGDAPRAVLAEVRPA